MWNIPLGRVSEPSWHYGSELARWLELTHHRANSPLSELHIPIHRRQPDPPAALADRGAEVAGVDAAGDRHRPVGLEAAVHGAQLDLGVDVLPELGDHVAVDAREIEVLRSDASHPRVHGAVHAVRLHGAAAARRVDTAVHRARVDLAGRSVHAHLAVHGPRADVHVLRQADIEVDGDVVVAVPPALVP